MTDQLEPDQMSEDDLTSEAVETTGPTTSVPDRLIKVWETHPSIVMSAAGVTFITFRLLFVGYGSTTTALALLQVAPISSILVGTLIPGTVVALGFLCGQIFSLVQKARAQGDTDRLRLLAVVIAAMAFLGVVLLPPIALLMLGVVAVCDLALPTRPGPPRSPDEVPRWLRRFFITVVALGVCASTWFIMSMPWWPTESVKVKGEKPFTAYVVASDDDETIVLRNHVLERIDSDTIRSRDYCDEGGTSWLFTRLAEHLGDGYPDCPS